MPIAFRSAASVVVPRLPRLRGQAFGVAVGASLGCGGGGGGEPSAPAVVAQVIVSPATQTLASGATVTLVATPQDAAGRPLSGRVITWATGDPARATVTANGVVTAGLVVEGTAQPVEIRASSEGRTGVATLTVLPVAVGRVVLTPDAAQLMAGAATQFSVAVLGADGTPLSGRDIQWSTSDAAIATVSAPGAVTTVPYVGGLVRLVKVIVRSEGVADTAEVTVTPVPVASVGVTPGGGAVVEGDTLQLAVTTSDSTGRTLTGRAVTFATSDPAVATVSATGRVIATPYTGNVLSRPVTISAASEGRTANVPLQVTVDLNRASTYYQFVPGAMPNLASHYQAVAGSGALYAPLVVDLNKDGRDDIVLHIWHFRNSLERTGWSLTAPVPNRLIALVANPDGSYADRTQQLFGTTAVDLAGGTSRAVRAQDLNGDGYPDWVYALNREDGRPLVDPACPPFNSSQVGGAPLCWTNQAAAVLSNGDGTYRVVPFGFTKYHHLVGIHRAADGKWHITFNANDFNDPGTYRYDGGDTFTWQPGYPNHGIGTMLGFSSSGGPGTDRFLTDTYEGTIPAGMVLYGGGVGAWQELARFQWSSFRQVDFVEDGNVSRDWVVYHQGKEYLTGGWWESCALRMSPGAPTTMIAAFHTSILNAGTQGRTQINASEPRTAWHKLFAFHTSGNQLVDAGLFPATAEGPYPAYFFTCADVNGDGFTDVVPSYYGVAPSPRVFLNQQGAGFAQVPATRFPVGPAYDFSYLLADSNGDGIKDLVYFPMGCNGGVHCAVFSLHRGRRHLR